jgi:Rha family phage regulatory protein
MNDLVIIKEGKVMTTSRIVADSFGKLHKNVLQSIQGLECSEDFRGLNFQLTRVIEKVGATIRYIPYYEMTRDGFAFLVMGFTGKKAAEFKEAFIREFNRMEQHIQEQQRPQQMSDEMIVARALQITQRTIEDQKKQIEEMLPKAEAFDHFLDGEGLFNIRTTAKMLGVGLTCLGGCTSTL